MLADSHAHEAPAHVLEYMIPNYFKFLVSTNLKPEPYAV
jgi:hypothetical protein